MITWDCAQCHLQCLTKALFTWIWSLESILLFQCLLWRSIEKKTPLCGHCCGNWNRCSTEARLSARCGLIMKTVPSKLVNTGTFAWTEEEFGSLLHVEKSEQHKQNSAICHIMAHAQKLLTVAVSNVHAPFDNIVRVPQIPPLPDLVSKHFSFRGN